MAKIFKGCDVLDASELALDKFLPQVERTSTYYPLPHVKFYLNAASVLREIGIGIVNTSFGLTPKRDRMFMWLETDAKVDGMPLCIGGRNSYDKSMSAGLCVGTKIMVCSNKVLASYENGGVVSRKHTSAENIDELSKEFNELVNSQTKSTYSLFSKAEHLKDTLFEDDDVRDLLSKLVIEDVIRPTDIKLIWNERERPRYPEFENYRNTAYGFLMAATEIFKLHPSPDYQIKAYDGVAKALGL